MVSQPPAVRVVKWVGAKSSRPIALNVPASTKCWSPAYSVRISVGESTSNRASPDVTAEARAPPRVALTGAAAARGITAGQASPATISAATPRNQDRRRPAMRHPFHQRGRMT
jgi:hypothetical protein